MNSGLTISEDRMEGRVPVTVFHIKGDIDGSTYEQLQNRASEAFKAGTRHLLLDLSEVPYISSAGIRALHYIFNLLRSDPAAESDEKIRTGVRSGAFKSPHLKLLNPNSGVTRVLEMAGYDMFLEIHRDQAEAVKSF
jgi:anti-anti-sigma regulatory factor